MAFVLLADSEEPIIIKTSFASRRTGPISFEWLDIQCACLLVRFRFRSVECERPAECCEIITVKDNCFHLVDSSLLISGPSCLYITSPTPTLSRGCERPTAIDWPRDPSPIWLRDGHSFSPLSVKQWPRQSFSTFQVNLLLNSFRAFKYNAVQQGKDCGEWRLRTVKRSFVRVKHRPTSSTVSRNYIYFFSF